MRRRRDCACRAEETLKKAQEHRAPPSPPKRKEKEERREREREAN